ncbi:MAG TPA: hypothetical protein VND65_04240 [Candidatus Binatia bacterium]|nr:hypothetical protein [Candidatus Binatia bacterium]
MRLAVFGCAAFFWQLIAYNFVDIDLWHQMGLIRESVAAGHLLKTDVFAYTPTLPWIDHEWGAGAIAFLAVKWFGPRAIIVLKFATAFGTLCLCFWVARLRATDFRLLVLCTPAAIFLWHLGFLSTIRAQAYTFFFTALWLLFLQLDRRGRTWIPVALLVFPFWVNIHGGFVIGLAVLLLQAGENFLRGESWRHVLVLTAALTGEIFLNPYGRAYFSYLKRGLLMPRPYSGEWDSIYHLGPLWVAIFAGAIVWAFCSAWWDGWRGADGGLFLAATAAEAALHRKLLPLFAISWLCCVPDWSGKTSVGEWLIRFSHRRRHFLASAWIFAGCVCVYSAVQEKPWALDVPQPLYPVGPVNYLKQQKFAGNLMTPFRLGAYASWKLYPAVKVSLDSRYEVAFPDDVVKSVFDFYEARPDWRKTLEAFPTDAVLVPVDAPIVGKLPDAGWTKSYEDRQFQIYARPGLSLTPQTESSVSLHGTFP